MKSSLSTELPTDELLADDTEADKARADKISATDSEKGMPDNAPGGKTIAIFNTLVLLIRRCLECLD